MKIDVTIRSPKIAFLASRFSPAKRTEMNSAMALHVRELTRTHLAKLAAERHTTAEKLGATPSGHLAQAVRAVEAAPIEANANSATLVINHPGLGRAFHDVTITPKSAKALTIPVAAMAYNRRAGQFSNLFVYRSKTTGNAFLAMRQEEKTDRPLLLYLLVRSVTQKQDRTLLPSNDEWETAAAQGAKDFILSQS